MDYPDYDFAKAGKRWIAYFDLLGFRKYVENRSLIDVYGLLDTCWACLFAPGPPLRWNRTANDETKTEAQQERGEACG